MDRRSNPTVWPRPTEGLISVRDILDAYQECLVLVHKQTPTACGYASICEVLINRRTHALYFLLLARNHPLDCSTPRSPEDSLHAIRYTHSFTEFRIVTFVWHLKSHVSLEPLLTPILSFKAHLALLRDAVPQALRKACACDPPAQCSRPGDGDGDVDATSDDDATSHNHNDNHRHRLSEHCNFCDASVLIIRGKP